MSARTHVLLDLDGTLSDSEPGIVRSLQWACELEGFPVPDDATVRSVIGPPFEIGLPMIGIPDDALERVVDRYRERYTTIGAYENTLYDGIIDLLDRLRHRNAGLGDRGLKGVQVDHDHINPWNPVRLSLLSVRISQAQDATMNLRVQRLHATVHHLWVARVVGYRHHRDGGLAQRTSGPASGENGVAEPLKGLTQFDNAGLESSRVNRNQNDTITVSGFCSPCF